MSHSRERSPSIRRRPRIEKLGTRRVLAAVFEPATVAVDSAETLVLEPVAAISSGEGDDSDVWVTSPLVPLQSLERVSYALTLHENDLLSLLLFDADKTFSSGQTQFRYEITDPSGQVSSGGLYGGPHSRVTTQRLNYLAEHAGEYRIELIWPKSEDGVLLSPNLETASQFIVVTRDGLMFSPDRNCGQSAYRNWSLLYPAYGDPSLGQPAFGYQTISIAACSGAAKQFEMRDLPTDAELTVALRGDVSSDADGFQRFDRACDADSVLD